MAAHVTVAGKMQECGETTELYRPEKDVFLATMGEPMVKTQQRNQMPPGHRKAQAVLGEEPLRNGAYAMWYWDSGLITKVRWNRQACMLHKT